jgi:hypothetical protein
MGSIYDLIDQQYLTPRNVLTPATLVIDRVVWDEYASEGLIYFVGVAKPYSLRDDDWIAFQAITGEADWNRWMGRTIRLYPVNFPRPDLEPF